MILEILLTTGIVVGFLNSRSTTLADRALSGQYFIEGKSGFLNLLIAVLMFLGMISTFAIIIWGFNYFKSKKLSGQNNAISRFNSYYYECFSGYNKWLSLGN
jgi:hypothetical protein